MENKTRILIVDDDSIVRENLVAFLEDEDFLVDSVKDAEEGLKRIEDNSYDIAIVDMRLPGIDGSQFIIKTNEMSPNTKFIIHTGSTNFSLNQKLKDLGITKKELFMKPIRDMNTFVEEIKELIND
ncbi:MAG: two-component system response regulator [Candidatus Muiribacterium halophilum]|uniref:Two-component system response regulator n=1 Tax=Muiribacterium halophilum TaxID=2053465 RepID=A0A2N5ZGE3_MUIH1|nr:MAG: two-component system response regulator [Candidatus Muirbacterium halophilum]